MLILDESYVYTQNPQVHSGLYIVPLIPTDIINSLGKIAESVQNNKNNLRQPRQCSRIAQYII